MTADDTPTTSVEVARATRPKLIGAKAAALILNCSDRYVRDLCAAGKLPGAKQVFGRNTRWLVPRESAERLKELIELIAV